ncbi:MAG: AarF/UbiB family protein, partial [Gemmatimonadaceae bacterium]
GIEAYHPEISQMIAEELDFTAEARNIVRIAAFFDGDPAVGFPTVIAERSTARVLTTEFVQGTKITDFAGLAAAGLDRRMLAERVVRAYCRMIFVEGVYHADPHPGNILVAADGSIVFIDFGAVGVLSPTMRAGVAAFVEGVLQRDVGRISEAMRTMGFVARDARSEDVARRVVDYMQQRFLDQLATGAWNLGDIQMDLGTKLEMIGDLRKLDLSFRQITASFQVPKDWVLLERTLLLLVGLCTELDPSWNPMTVIRPYLEDAVLGHDRDWTEILRGAVKDWVLRAATLPEGLQQLLTRANGGELVVRVPEITVASRLLYAAAHQLLYGLLGTAACVLAYQANDRGRAFLTWSLSAAAVVCFVSLLVSLSTTKRLTD